MRGITRRCCRWTTTDTLVEPPPSYANAYANQTHFGDVRACQLMYLKFAELQELVAG